MSSVCITSVVNVHISALHGCDVQPEQYFDIDKVIIAIVNAFEIAIPLSIEAEESTKTNARISQCVHEC